MFFYFDVFSVLFNFILFFIIYFTPFKSYFYTVLCFFYILSCVFIVLVATELEKKDFIHI